jgi:hypothetical protein
MTGMCFPVSPISANKIALQKIPDMNLRWLTFFISLVTGITASAQIQSGTDLLREMHRRYKEGPCKAYTFSQKNSHYRNDTLMRTSEWHEAVEFPDKFRITFGEKGSGNYVLFRNDSVYNYRKDAVFRSQRDSNNLLLLLGGMYYRKFDDVVARLKHAGYQPDVLSEQVWNGKPVYVLGAKAGDDVINQIWIDKKSLVIVRIIEKMDSGDIMDMRFESHQAWCNGYVENKVSFRRNGNLEQVEEYYDLKKQPGFLIVDK